MHNPLEFYIQEKETLSTQLAHLKKQLLTNSIVRLLVFLATSFGVYSTFGNFPIVVVIGFIGIVIFAFLVVKHISLQDKRNLAVAKININTTEINALNRDVSGLATGEEFINPLHFYSNDIDLFGVGSFFQYLNRTVTNDGKKLLANTLLANEITAILEKQKALQELAKKIKWRQHFSAIASLVTVKTTTTKIVNWLQNYKTQLPAFLGVFSKVFSLLSIVIIVLLTFKVIPFSVVVIWLFLGLAITGFFLKKIQYLYKSAGKAKDVFSQYYQLLAQIEEETFSSLVLQEKQQKIQSESKKASVIFKAFSKILDAFDQRNNIIIAVVGNGLFLWDIQQAVKTENWIETYKDTVKKWFEVVSFFDAQNSLSNFVYNHPNYVFPILTQESVSIISQNLGHPLLDPSKRIDNNFTINNKEFFIVTGANMAGKSTFLRTVSLSIVMANCGLPICASSFEYRPVKLITSMRTSDSLIDDSSYFYAELKRLKFIVEEIKTENYFIILDEILKGTNSKDKAIGSKKFVEKLSNSKSTGIIATHDVSLCDLAVQYPQIKNYYFDAEIINNELYFDYKMKNGVCKNMNASFLLKKMEII